MKFHNKTLTVEQEEVLKEAVKAHNRFYKARDESFVEITEEDYLTQLIEKQIEGLRKATESEKALERIEAERIEQARKRIGLTF